MQSLLFRIRLRTSGSSYIYSFWVFLPLNHHCGSFGVLHFCQDPELLSQCWCLLRPESTHSPSTLVDLHWYVIIYTAFGVWNGNLLLIILEALNPSAASQWARCVVDTQIKVVWGRRKIIPFQDNAFFMRNRSLRTIAWCLLSFYLFILPLLSNYLASFFSLCFPSAFFLCIWLFYHLLLSNIFKWFLPDMHLWTIFLPDFCSFSITWHLSLHLLLCIILTF